MAAYVAPDRNFDSFSSPDVSWCSSYSDAGDDAAALSQQIQPTARSNAAAAAAWSVDSLPAFMAGSLNAEQQAVVESLQGLSDMASELCVILAKAEYISPALRNLNFVAVKSSTQYSLDFFRTHVCPPRARAILIVQVGLEVEDQALKCTDALSRNAHTPALIVVLIPRPLDEHDRAAEALDAEGAPDGGETMATTVRHVARRDLLAQTQDKYIEHGADDFISLDQGETMMEHMALVAIHRAELQAQKFVELNEQLCEAQQQAAKEVQDAKQQLCRKMQIAWKELMWNMPGRLLEGIPQEDRNLEERPAVNDECWGGVGDFTFVAKLGVDHDGGMEAVTFRAEHPELKTVAVKVIQKSSVKNLGQLVSVDQEMRIMHHIPPHPNVTRALSALHTQRNIFLVLDYSGNMNLHRFTQQSIAHTGEQALPKDLARSFVEQMASGVAHLHAHLVVHRDLKPTNFLVSDSQDKLRLAEFNLVTMCCSRKQLLMQCCGSLPFCAPEVLRQQDGNGSGYDAFAADIWSLAGNFAELGLGPYGIERLLGWVPAADSDRRLEDLEHLPEIWADVEDMGVPGLNNIVAHMLRLQPSERWTAYQVAGRQGLGIDLAPRPPSRGGLKLHVGESFTANRVASRTVDSELHRPEDYGLLERLGGAGAMRKALEAAFDEAMTSTSLGVVLDGCPAATPAIRSLYSDEAVQYFSAEPSSKEALAALNRMTAAHSCWMLSDADFDVFAEHFGAALGRLGVRKETAQEAVVRFGHLREAATDSFQVGAAHARQRNSASWKQEVASAGERSADFAAALSGILGRNQELAEGVPPELKSPQGIEAELLKYFRGEAGARGPLPLQPSSLSLDQLALLVDCARRALVEAHWQPEDVMTIYFALKEEWDRVRLDRELRKLNEHTSGVGQAAWMLVALRLQQALQSHPDTAKLCDSDSFLRCLAQICATLQKGDAEDPRQHLPLEGCGFGPRHMHFDALLAAVQEACADLPEGAPEQAAAALRAMRPWVLLGCRRPASASVGDAATVSCADDTSACAEAAALAVVASGGGSGAAAAACSTVADSAGAASSTTAWSSE